MTKCGLLEMPSFTLVPGIGDYEQGQACVMSAAVACYRLSKGEPLGEATDELECCCPVLRSFLIRLNDSRLWSSDKHRTDVLMPFVNRLAGTKNDSLNQQRAYILADFAVRNMAARAMDSANMPKQPAKLRALAEIIDVRTSQAAAADAARWSAADGNSDDSYMDVDGDDLEEAEEWNLKTITSIVRLVAESSGDTIGTRSVTVAITKA